MTKNYKSLISLIFCFFVFVFASTVAYPKWKKENTEATISWDVSGYYWYLPATFIYKDLKILGFTEKILVKYQPTPSLTQAYQVENGNYVMGYSCGQALHFLPAFAIAHNLAPTLGYPADGFSKPYQIAISINSLIVALIGLIFLRKILLQYFDDTVAAITIFLISVGTNYLDYGSITGAMTHNWLFTVYCLLIFTTIRFYQKPTFRTAFFIGILVGWAALTRPTEIISCLIPLAWGVHNKETVLARFLFIKQHFSKLFLAVLVAILLGSIQFVYWKYVTGHFFVYSYKGQTFSWLRPHLINGIFSYRAGWLVYTPIMIFAILGFIPLGRSQKSILPTIFVFCGLFVYICFAWDIWWYGGSLGQRAMVQSYPIWAFPLAAFVQWVLRFKIKYLFAILASLCIYYNVWLTYQAHGGGLIDAGNMTKAYFWKVFLKYRENVPLDAVKLLDTDEEFVGERKDVKTIYTNNFDKDTLNCPSCPDAIGKICLNKACQFAPKFNIPIQNDASFEWIRANIQFECQQKEWDFWRMPQLIIQFSKDEKIIKLRGIRTHRLLNDGETKTLFLDIQKPNEPFDKVTVIVWEADSQKPFFFDNVVIEKFK